MINNNHHGSLTLRTNWGEAAGEFGSSEDETSYLGTVHSLSRRIQAAHSDSPGGVRKSMLRSLAQVIPQLVTPGSFESLGNQPLNNSAQLLAGIRHGLGKHMGMGVCVCDVYTCDVCIYVYVHACVYTWMCMYVAVPCRNQRLFHRVFQSHRRI